jgi:hypothetical protein
MTIHTRSFIRLFERLTGWALAALILTIALPGLAAPQARILRISPLASFETGKPIITTVVEIVQTKRVSAATKQCANLSGDRRYRCMSEALEKPNALYSAFVFPPKNALLTVQVDNHAKEAHYVSDAKWGDSLSEPGVGTAWLVMVDAGSKMRGFDAARKLTKKFIDTMGPNDIVNVMFFNDRAVFSDSEWIASDNKAEASTFVEDAKRPKSSSARTRRLSSIIKQGVNDGFQSLGNVGSKVEVPMHQALVLLSSGYGGADPGTTGIAAAQLRQYMSNGRFPDDNTALPKSPLPVISVWYPPKTVSEFKQNAGEFMENMANPEVGGFFSIMLPNQGSAADKIVTAVRGRFAKMNIVKWRVACLAPSVTQTFALSFKNMKQPIAGDNSFKDVPIGIDPSEWPLDINRAYTRDNITAQGGVFPGGTFRIFGNFCWGGDKSRAEVYFLPEDQKPLKDLTGTSPEEARKIQQQLTAMGLRGSAIEVTEAFGEFLAPDTEGMILGSGDHAVARLIVYDNQAYRTSGVTSATILEVPATTAPMPILWLLIGAFAIIVVLLLLLLLVRSRPRRAPPPPAPVVAPQGGGGGYGGPPAASGGYGAPPAAGGYGAAPAGAAPAAAPVTPQSAQAVPPEASAATAAVPITAPDAPPEPAAPPAAPAGFAAVNQAPPVGGGPPMGAVQKTAPGISPFAPGAAAPGGAPAGGPTRATLQSPAGVFTVMAGTEVHAGRDPAQCVVLLAEARVSGVHATMKLESGQFFVRDENSNNGTFVNAVQIGPGAWTPVPQGSVLRFGPVELTLHLD